MQRLSRLCPRRGFSTALSARYDGWAGLYDEHGQHTIVLIEYDRQVLHRLGTQRQGRQGLVKSRPRKQIANAVTTSPPGCFADPRDGLGNTTPHIVYEYE